MLPPPLPPRQLQGARGALRGCCPRRSPCSATAHRAKGEGWTPGSPRCALAPRARARSPPASPPVVLRSARSPRAIRAVDAVPRQATEQVRHPEPPVPKARSPHPGQPLWPGLVPGTWPGCLQAQHSEAAPASYTRLTRSTAFPAAHRARSRGTGCHQTSGSAQLRLAMRRHSQWCWSSQPRIPPPCRRPVTSSPASFTGNES